MKVLVRILQVIVALFVLLLVISFFASNDDSNKATSEQKEEQTAQVETETKDTQKKNDKGVYIFDSIPAYFEYANDYDVDDGEVTFINGDSTNIKVTPFELSESNILDDFNKESFLKLVYKLFIHTNADSFTLEMYPAIINKDRTIKKPLTQLSIKGKISREKALSVLQEFSTATSFDSLIITDKDKLPEWGTLGSTTTKVFSDFVHNNKNAVLEALLGKKIKDTVLIKKKVPDGEFDFATVVKKINKQLSGSPFSIPKNFKVQPSDKPTDVNEVAQLMFRDGFGLLISVNKETKRVNQISTTIQPSMGQDELAAILFINSLIIASLDSSNGDVDKLLTDNMRGAIENFSKKQETTSKKFSVNGLNYSVTISKELGFIFSSVSYPMPEE